MKLPVHLFSNFTKGFSAVALIVGAFVIFGYGCELLGFTAQCPLLGGL